ncbi:MAG: N-acetylmuramic acid 6-phosphate etherase [Chloroflexota bacterium]
MILQTENRNPKTMHMDQMSTEQLLTVMNEEDATVPLAVRTALPQLAELVDKTAERIRAGGRLLYVGAGTSGRLGVLDASECVPTFGVPPTLVQGIMAGGETALVTPVEGAEDDREAGQQALIDADLQDVDTVVGIAASGRTPFVLAAVEYANAQGALTGGVACNVPSPLLEAAQIPIGLPVGPEVLTGSTRLKAGTAQKMALNMLSTGVMVRLGKTYGNLMVDVQVTNAKLKDRAERIIMEVTGVTQVRAAELLAEAGQQVKVAIVMELRDVSFQQAQALLDEAEGHLRTVLEL